jgi:hypothetical protein
MKSRKCKDLTLQEIGKIIDNNQRSFYNFDTQINICEDSRDDEMKFTEYLYSMTEHKRIDYLDCSEYSGRRATNLVLGDIKDYYTSPSYACGIKIIHRPVMYVHPWDKWEDGHIEGFIRFSKNGMGNDYFVWTYIRMEKLMDIIKTFKSSLCIWDINYEE